MSLLEEENAPLVLPRVPPKSASLSSDTGGVGHASGLTNWTLGRPAFRNLSACIPSPLELTIGGHKLMSPMEGRLSSPLTAAWRIADTKESSSSSSSTIEAYRSDLYKNEFGLVGGAGAGGKEAGSADGRGLDSLVGPASLHQNSLTLSGVERWDLSIG